MYEKLDRSEGCLVGYEVSDEVTEDDVDGILDDIEETIATHDEPARVLLRFDSLPSFDFGALDEDLRFWREYGDDVERYAVVADGRLVEGLVALEDALTEMDIRQFERDSEDAAWAWLV